MNDTLNLFYEMRESNTVDVEVNDTLSPLAHDVTVEQVLNIAKLFTRKYDTVKLYDGEYEAYLTFTKGEDTPTVETHYPEDRTDVEKKYGLYVESDDDEYVDLEKEKWDNYWSDYNQCGIRVGY